MLDAGDVHMWASGIEVHLRPGTHGCSADCVREDRVHVVAHGVRMHCVEYAAGCVRVMITLANHVLGLRPETVISHEAMLSRAATKVVNCSGTERSTKRTPTRMTRFRHEANTHPTPSSRKFQLGTVDNDLPHRDLAKRGHLWRAPARRRRGPLRRSTRCCNGSSHVRSAYELTHAGHLGL